MYLRPGTKLTEIDPDWARRHRFSMWSTGFTSDQIRWVCSQPSFTAQKAMKAKAELKAELNASKAELAAYKAIVENGEAKKSSKPAADKDKMDSKPAADDKKGGSSKPDFIFTKDEDNKLLELKANGETWKTIAQQLKKPQGDLKKRFSEIATDDQKNANQGKNSTQQKSKEDEKCDCSCHKSKDKGKKADKSSGDKAGKGSSSGSRDGALVGEEHPYNIYRGGYAGFTNPEYIVLYPNDECDEEVCIALARVLYEDHDNYYHRLSSRVFDETGKYISEGAINRIINNSLTEARTRRRAF